MTSARFLCVIQLLEVTLNAETNDLPQAHRDGITDHSAYRFKANLIGWQEFVVIRERLQRRGLPKRDSTILGSVIMPKTPIAKAIAERGHGWTGAIGAHTSINAWVSLARSFAMTVRAKIFGPVFPGATRLGALDAL